MCKSVYIIFIVFLLISCSNIVWDNRPRAVESSAIGTSDVAIVIGEGDPMLEYIYLMAKYESSEYYGVIDFVEWYTYYMDGE